MTPDDRRHGTHAGYVAGCHEECCMAARRRARKQRDVIRLTAGTCLISHETFRAAIDPWLQLGLSPYAIEEATGIGSRIADTLRSGSEVLRSTHAAIVAMTEDAIPGTAKVYADLTRARVDSLMAIGHRLLDMPINSRGHWRKREYVSVETARQIRDYYAAHEFKIGPDAHTAARARNRGARPPLAWDDPGTLAWPGKPASVVLAAPDRDHVDEAVVDRILAGDACLAATRAERLEVIRRWPGSQTALERLRPDWNVARDLRDMRADGLGGAA